METLANQTSAQTLEDTTASLNGRSRVWGSSGLVPVQNGLGIEPVGDGLDVEGVSVGKMTYRGSNGVDCFSLVGDEMLRKGVANGINFGDEDAFGLSENGKIEVAKLFGDFDFDGGCGSLFNGSDSFNKIENLGVGNSVVGDSAKKVEALRFGSSVEGGLAKKFEALGGDGTSLAGDSAEKVDALGGGNSVWYCMNGVTRDRGCEGVELAFKKNPTMGSNQEHHFTLGHLEQGEMGRRNVTDGLASVSRRKKQSKDIKSGYDSVLAEDGSSRDKLVSCVKEPKERKLSRHHSKVDKEKDAIAKKNADEANGGKTVIFSRERKKSKYLSPPYTTLSKGFKSLISPMDCETKTLQIPEHLVKGSEETSRKEPSKESSNQQKLKKLSLKVANVAAEKLLTDFYSSALDPFYLKEMQLYGLIKGFFMQFRISRTIVDPEMVGDNLTSQFDRTSFDSTIGSSGMKKYATTHPLSEGGAEGKKRKRKKEAILTPETKGAGVADGTPSHNGEANNETSFATMLMNSSSGEKMHATKPPTSGGVVEGKKKKSNKEAMIGCSEIKPASIADGRPILTVETKKGVSWAKNLLNLEPEENMCTSDHPISEDVAKVKRRNRKKEARSVNSETKAASAASGKPNHNVEDNKETSSAMVLLNSAPGEKMCGTNHPISEGVAEGKRRKTKQEARSVGSAIRAAIAANGRLSRNVVTNKETSSVSIHYDFASGEDMHVTNHPTSGGVAEGKKGESNKATFVTSGTKVATAADSNPSPNVVSNNESSSATVRWNFSPGAKMQATNHPVFEGVAEGNKGTGEKEIIPVNLDIEAASAADELPNNNVDMNNETSSATLLLNFGPGVPLPTKDALVTVFGRFGALNELDTKIMKDSGCAQVIFTKCSNAEEAFSSIQDDSPFGPDTDSYLIKLGSATFMDSIHGVDSLQCRPHRSRKRSRSRAGTSGDSKRKARSKQVLSSPPCLPQSVARGKNSPSSDSNRELRLECIPVPLKAVGSPSAQQLLSISPPPLAEVPSLPLIRQNLEKMTSMLETAGHHLLPEVKANLETEIKKLLTKVTTMVESPRPLSLTL